MDERLRSVEIQLATLNGSLPALREKLDSVGDAIKDHEANAQKRMTDYASCKEQRQSNTKELGIIKWVLGITIPTFTAFILKNFLAK